VDEAVKLLAASEDARALAGGQSLVNVMKTRVAAPELVVDLNRVDSLRGIREDGGALEIGAMTTYAAIVDSPEVASARPILAEVARTIADVQVRNRGTIGGNVCSNDPTNHFPPLLAALQAGFTIRSAAGDRTATADEFFEGVFATAVHPGELLTSIRVPAKGDARDGWASATLGKDGTGIVSVAATVSAGNARIAIGCVSATPVVVTASADETAVADAVKSANLDPPGDVHASADYRRHLAAVLAARAVRDAA
jgi:carbon-monoxide dehydrogenase medium subunit